MPDPSVRAIVKYQDGCIWADGSAHAGRQAAAVRVSRHATGAAIDLHMVEMLRKLISRSPSSSSEIRVSVDPLSARVLHGGECIGRIEMLPSAPLPDFSALLRQLHQVSAHILPFTSVPGVHLGSFWLHYPANSDAHNRSTLPFFRQPSVVMMIRFAHLPENSAVFQLPPALRRPERRPAQKCIVGNFSVVKE